jgi:carboxyl-terminal processing protease
MDGRHDRCVHHKCPVNRVRRSSSVAERDRDLARALDELAAAPPDAVEEPAEPDWGGASAPSAPSRTRARLSSPDDRVRTPPPMSMRRVLAVAGAVLVALAVFVAGVAVGGHAQALGLTRLSDPIRGVLLGDSGEDLASQVLDALRDGYYEPIDEEALQRSSADAVVEALGDPYTDYLDPDELAAQRQSYDGTFSGVGLQVAQRDEAIVVTDVLDGGAASEVDIRVGDRVVSVDGDPTTGRSLSEVVALIRGEEGTEVRVGVRTPGGPERQYTLERRTLRDTVVVSRVERASGESVGYLRLSRFTRGATAALRDQVASLRDRGVGALVLDMRGDPGGLVSEAVGVAGAFLPDGSEVVVTEGRRSPRKVFSTDDEPVAGDLPLAVLVDRGSASASEIVAGALRDADRATLVGQRTFGKALVQTTVPLRDGGALKLTTARYLTPSGFDLAERGLPPAVRVVDDPRTPVDEALRRAVALAAAEA